MHRIFLLSLLWGVILLTPSQAQTIASGPAPLPARNIDIQPEKKKNQFTMTIGGPVETRTIVVQEGNVATVDVGDLIEVGLHAASPYKGRITWRISPNPPASGTNEKRKSVYFGTGKGGTKFHIEAWGVREAKDDDGKPIPNTIEAYIEADYWVQVRGAQPNPVPDTPDTPVNPEVDPALKETLAAAYGKDKSMRSTPSSHITGAADVCAAVADGIKNKSVLSASRVMIEFHDGMAAKSIKNDTMPNTRDAIADYMEATAGVDWSDAKAFSDSTRSAVETRLRTLSATLKSILQ